MSALRLKLTGTNTIKDAVQAMGPGSFNEAVISNHIRPLFSRVLDQFRDVNYLANHSLGRPLNQTEYDVQEGMSHWYNNMDDAWGEWGEEMSTFRRQIADLIHAQRPDCVIPKTSAGQGLRTILNCFDRQIQVVTSRDEFVSIDHILKNYADRERIYLTFIQPAPNGYYQLDRIIDSIHNDTDLVVISMVMFSTGQLLNEISTLVTAAHDKGAKVLLDLYHTVGVVPVDITRMNAAFAIGGCYKYLRGGPGACWLYLHPQHLDGSLTSLDTGWFAQPHPFAFERPENPQFAGGGDRFLESTPAILPFYQARAGLEFTLALGVERIRSYSMRQQAFLETQLREQKIPFLGSIEERGAFVAIPHRQAELIAKQLKQAGILCDAREGKIRLCPDLLNTEQELAAAVLKLKQIWRDL